MRNVFIEKQKDLIKTKDCFINDWTQEPREEGFIFETV